ncbi:MULTISPECIES: universal stress protein [Pseudomonas]|uniref:universal stress protein n=1 Tax=Pseudomonadaceae TaxID=135621 RepID=UPI0010F43A35|nr:MULTISPECIES: universal stress protein [Pseudomonas]MDE3738909.1 universal stress protein [Pseudomonas resinovorans]
MSESGRVLLIGHTVQPHSAAFHRAVALARAGDIPLHIGILVEPLAITSMDKELRERVRDSLVNGQHQRWEGEVATLREKGVRATCSVSWTDDPLSEILRQVEEIKPEILVKDIHHESALRRVFTTPLDWHLLRDCPVPLHLVNEAGHPRPKLVVAAVDPTEPEAQYSGLNDRIIGAASRLALQCGSELKALFVYDAISPYGPNFAEAGSNWIELVEELRKAQHQAFVDLAERHGIPAEHRHFVMGHPILGIVEFADSENADVVVMGRVHRKGLGKLLGSTTESVLARLRGSVLAIQPQAR